MAFGEAGSREPTGAEFEEYLATAERLLRDSDALRRRGATARIAGSAASILLLPVVVAVAMAARTDAVSLVVTALVWLGASVAATRVVQQMVVAAAREQLSRDSEAAARIARLLSDVLPIIAEDEGWTHIRVRVAESRLARLPLGVEDR
ncbi:hypothetical protein [Dactylosporangium sp. NPDC050588]|uniref:hypothetical protein n=1 Tax=Dactylosporangium sp. NPDC050588 TaxID=3157211 RepID=UPI00340EDCB8